jgi:Asp-tRNA(Asn)/Glu-tRNA(Gln) amidotransferase A subunit family amidase
LVQLYLSRIEALDRGGPGINSIITVHPDALREADRLDAAYRTSGPVGPLHGVPVVLKDQIDAAGTPTTLGSVLFRDFYPERDAFVVEKLKQAGAIVLAKATLGELGQGDAHGSLFGSTRNPYDLERTVGGSSGGPAAAMSANLGAIAVGQEALASIRRPAAWNSIVGLRPTAGLVSRSGVYAGWPGIVASLGPMTRTVRDQAALLDVLVGYDAEDPATALGVGHAPGSYLDFLDPDGLKGARIGVVRESFGAASEQDSADFAKVARVFDLAIGELRHAGAEVIDPVVIPRLVELLAKRGAGISGSSEVDPWDVYFGRNAARPYQTRQDMLDHPDYAKVMRGPVVSRVPTPALESSQARDELMVGVMNVMAEHRLDALVYRSAEHQPTLIEDGIKPPFVNIKGTTFLNTFLVYVPAISVPAGFTSDGLPVGITLQGRPYTEGLMLKLAYAYEQATLHRKAPATTPALPGEP